MSAASVDDPFLRRELRGFPLLAARVAAGLLGALALFLFIRGIPGALARASAPGLNSRAPRSAALRGSSLRAFSSPGWESLPPWSGALSPR
jgi:hypothetical protein